MEGKQRFDGFPKTMYTARTRSVLSSKQPKSRSAMSTRTYSRIRGTTGEGADIEKGLRRSMNFEDGEGEAPYATSNMPTAEELENEREMLQRMIDQQKQLQDLQERQKRILDLQRQLASMDQNAGNVMEEKLAKLNAAKSRLDELQKLVGTIKTAESPEKKGAGDNVAKRLDDKNQRIRMALDELNDLKSLINMMSVSQYQNTDGSAVIKPVFENTINNAEDDESEGSYRPVLPEVSVVQQDEDEESDDEKALAYFRNPHLTKAVRSKDESTPLKPTPQFLDPFYNQNQRKAHKKKKKEVRGEPNEVSERLYSEMQRHQMLLKELRERRKELEDLMNMTKTGSETNGADYNDANESTRSNLGSPDESRGLSDAEENDFETSQSGRLFGLNESDTRRLIDIIRNQKSLGATTEKTTATWGSSSSDDSDDEKSEDETRSQSMVPPKEVVEAVLHSKDKSAKASPGCEGVQESLSLLQEAKELYDQRSGVYRGEHEIDYRPPTRRRQPSAQPRHDTSVYPATAWKGMVEKLQQDLSSSNATMHLLLEDQHALTQLLQNTLNLQQNSFCNNMCYGISPDFLIYQLDNCSAQFAALQKETKALQWQLYDITKNPPFGCNGPSSPGNRAAIVPYNKLPLDFLGKSRPDDFSDDQDEAPVPKDWNAAAGDNRKQELDKGANRSVPETEMLSQKPGVAAEDKEDDNSDLFEALRDSIYSEAAILISQNESRPHFLIELFRNLQKLNTDYLRQHCLYVLQDVMKGYIPESPRKKNEEKTGERAQKSPKKGSFSENTPSDSAATSEDELYARLKAKASADGGYDFSLKVSSASELSTPSGEEAESNPFAAEDLGSTVIHLDAALRHMREMERMKQEISAGGRNMEAPVTQMNGGDAPKSTHAVGEVAQVNTKLLRVRVKHIVSEVIPILKDNRDKTLDEDFLKKLQDKVLQIVAQTTIQNDKNTDEDTEDKENLTNFFSGQLNSIVGDSLNKFLGQRVGACGENLVIGLSEVLFNELAFYHMMQDLGKDKAQPAAKSNIPKIKVELEEDDPKEENIPVDEEVADKEQEKDDDSDSSATNENDATEGQEGSSLSDVKLDTTDKSGTPVTVDLSVSETKPLTSYGSGEDEEDGSGDDFTYKETDVPTSMQHDQDAEISQENDEKVAEEDGSSSESGSDKD